MRQTLDEGESLRIAAQHRDVLRGLYRVSRALGWLGIFLPAALVAHGLVWAGGMPLSISHSYHSAMGDVLVGTLCAIGIFLLAYKDFNPEEYVGGDPDRFMTGYWDRWFARAAGLGAIGVALFPVDPVTVAACTPIVADAPPLPCSTGGMTWHGHVALQWEHGALHNLLHFAPAGLFFLCICVICIRFFPEQPLKARYLGRNATGDFEIELTIPTRRTVFFTGMGLVIGVCVAGLGYMTAKAGGEGWLIGLLERNNGFFWLEVVAVLAFAVAWLAKARDFEAGLSLTREGGG